MPEGDRKLLASWGLLLALTFASFESAWGLAWLRDPRWAVALVIGVALVKVRIVMLDFMELRHAPWALRGALEAWLVALAGGILGLWYTSGT